MVDMVICSENREQVKIKLREVGVCPGKERKVSHSKIDNICVKERNPSETVRLQGAEDLLGVNTSEQHIMWERGKYVCASRFE